MWFSPTGQTATLPWRVSDGWPDLRGSVKDNTCCSVTWEGEKYWQDHCPHRTGDLCLWPKGFVFVVESLWQTHTCAHISSNLTVLPHLSSSILVSHSPFLSLCISVGSLVSTGSLSYTRSQPSLFFRSRIIWPPRGKLVYFGLVSMDPSSTVRSIPSTLQYSLSQRSTLCDHLFLLHTSSFLLNYFSFVRWPSQILGPLFYPVLMLVYR